MIEKIKYKDDEYLYSLIFKYFHPNLVRFGAKNDIEFLSTNTYELKANHLNDFNKMVKDALKELLSECYKEPLHKHRSKFPGRFEKIYVDGVKYVVDYRTDYIGKILYGLHYLMNWTNKHLETTTPT